MTPSPEERAREIVSRALAVDAAVKLGTEYLESLIASAIREAENDALESAAVLVEKRIVMKHLTSKTDLPELHIAAIRSLKSKD
jgi:hypothetical protein